MTIGAESTGAGRGHRKQSQPAQTDTAPERPVPDAAVLRSSAPQTWLWTLDNGLRVAFERRAGPGFAFDLRLPLGSAHDPLGREGSAGVLEEWLFKGAGGRDARALQDAFDDLGVRRGGGVGPEATRLGVSGLRADLPGALALLADVLLRPQLPEAELPVLLDLARQDLEALDDSPADLLAVQARTVAFGRGVPDQTGQTFAGFAHPASGTPGGLEAITASGLRDTLNAYGGQGSVLGLVVDAEPDEVLALVDGAFGSLRPGAAPRLQARFQAGGRQFVASPEAEQTHLSLTSPGVGPLDPHWMHWQLALTALCGGSASRLFHAVREERGLAYAVSASPVVLGGQGFLATYAGSTPARAPETLEVLLHELGRLGAGLSDAEFRRARAGLTASVVFGAESLRARATSLTRDVAVYGQIRSVAALRAQLAALTLDDVNAFLAGYDPRGPVTLVALGSQPLPGLESGAAVPGVGHD